MRIPIAEWFDVNDLEHLRAYQALEQTGQWPMAFLAKMADANVTLGNVWQVSLAGKMASAWIAEKLK